MVVDDFAPWRRFLNTLMIVTPEWQISGEAVTGAEALEKVRELEPDLVLLDIDLPDINGIDVARQLQTIAPNAKVIFLTAESSPEIVRAALDTGALGYLLKAQVVNELLPALTSVFAGKNFISQGINF
jgi:DNA-binding NarL/FixJ family response regulator